MKTSLADIGHSIDPEEPYCTVNNARIRLDLELGSRIPEELGPLQGLTSSRDSGFVYPGDELPLQGFGITFGLMAAERLNTIVLRTYSIRTFRRHTIGVFAAIDRHRQNSGKD
jgi:hypothetical protein